MPSGQSPYHPYICALARAGGLEDHGGMEQEEKLAADLAAAGAAIEAAVESLRQQGLGPMPIASAMLGGALGLLAQVMDDNAILNVLHSAATGVASGDLRRSLTQ